MFVWEMLAHSGCKIYFNVKFHSSDRAVVTSVDIMCLSYLRCLGRNTIAVPTGGTHHVFAICSLDSFWIIKELFR